MMNKQLQQFMSMLMDGEIAVNRKRLPTKSRTKKKKTKSAAKAPKDEAAIEQSRQKNNDLVLEAFTAAGYADVQPRVNVLTYDKWIEHGRRVRKGEKSIRVGNFALFHLDQTDEDSAEAA